MFRRGSDGQRRDRRDLERHRERLRHRRRCRKPVTGTRVRPGRRTHAHGERNGGSHAEWDDDAERDRIARGEPDGERVSDTREESDGNFHADRHTARYVDTDTIGHVDTNANRDVDTHTDRHTHADSDTDTNTDRYADTDTNEHVDSNTNGHVDAHTDRHANSHAVVDDDRFRMTATWLVGRRLAAAIPGMYPETPKRNVIVAMGYLYALGIVLATLSFAG